MAITINSIPANYSSMHDPLWFVVTSTNTGQTNFKYICDVYINNNLVARLKSFPQPSNSKGVFDVSAIIRSYWNSYFKPTVSLPTAFSYTGSDIYVNYDVKFGEEYGGSIYAALEEQNAFAYNYIIDYLPTPTSNIYITPANYSSRYAGKYITTRDRQEIRFNREAIETGFLFISSLANAENTNRVHSLVIDSYSPTLTTYTGGNVTFKDFGLLDISPRAINTYLNASAITANTEYYDVKFRIAGAVLDTCRVYLKCTQNDVIPLHFLNSLGGYDTFIFTAVNRQSRNIEKSKFETYEWIYSSSQMQRVNSYGVFNGGNINFSTRQQISYKLISDWVNATDFNWLKELIASPEVYMERNQQFIPVDITTTSWSEKKLYNDKQFNLELDIQLANRVNSQYR